MSKTATQTHNEEKLKGYKYTLDEVLQTYKRFREARQPMERIWNRIDAYESGKIWETVRKRFPKHQLLVDTNYLQYIKKAKTNSIYSGAYFADIKPVHQVYEEAARQLNKFIEHEYKANEIPFKMALAGSIASTKGMGALLFGWDSKKVDTNTGEKYHTGGMVVDYIDIFNIVLDPTVTDYQKGQALFIPGQKTLSELKAIYPEEMEAYFKHKRSSKAKATEGSNVDHQHEGTAQPKADMGQGYDTQRDTQPQDKAVKFMTAYYKYYDAGEHRLDELIIIDDDYVLSARKGIQPNYFPVVILYSMLPEKSAYAHAPASVVMANCLTINILKSIRATHTYMSQRRAQIMRAGSGINPHNLAKNMYNPSKVIVATGDVNNVIHPIEIPDLPKDMPQQIEDLQDDIFTITGIDLRYMGRDTGSATTTGGVSQILERSSVVTDNLEVMLLEKAATQVTKLIVDLHVEHSSPVEILVRHKNSELQTPITIDFPGIKQGVTEKGIHDSENPENNISALFDYDLEAGPLLPKNRARHAEAANIMMEKQMQYQFNPPLITSEEWLKAQQDFPQKNDMLDRMRIEKLTQDEEEIASNVMNFNALTRQGLTPDEAVGTLAEEKQLHRDSMKLGNVMNANTFQSKQGA